MKTLVILALIGFAAAQIQVQIPIQRPQQPQQQFPVQPQFPTFPQQPPRQPVAPRANWRLGQPDSRCPIPDDHDGYAFFLPGNGEWDFFICWGGYAWPFNCPQGLVFRPEVNTCAHPGWEPSFRRPRPFAEEEEEEDNE